jgi:hypothetical protein
MLKPKVRIFLTLKLKVRIFQYFGFKFRIFLGLKTNLFGPKS